MSVARFLQAGAHALADAFQPLPLGEILVVARAGLVAHELVGRQQAIQVVDAPRGATGLGSLGRAVERRDAVVEDPQVVVPGRPQSAGPRGQIGRCASRTAASAASRPAGPAGFSIGQRGLLGGSGRVGTRECCADAVPTVARSGQRDGQQQPRESSTRWDGPPSFRSPASQSLTFSSLARGDPGRLRFPAAPRAPAENSSISEVAARVKAANVQPAPRGTMSSMGKRGPGGNPTRHCRRLAAQHCSPKTRCSS